MFSFFPFFPQAYSQLITTDISSQQKLSQIVRVLNGHLTQLQWIDTNASALQAKVVAAQKATGNMGASVGGPDTDAAESFYRSYRGGYK